jgi:hypothetical protein
MIENEITLIKNKDFLVAAVRASTTHSKT